MTHEEAIRLVIASRMAGMGSTEYPPSRSHRLANLGAVPHTRRHRRGYWLRRPHGKTAALRAEVRPGAVPPDAWDDIPIAALSSRTWKRHRRTQYHPDKQPTPAYWAKVYKRRRDRIRWPSGHLADALPYVLFQLAAE